MLDLSCRYPNSPRSPSREDAPHGDDDADDGCADNDNDSKYFAMEVYEHFWALTSSFRPLDFVRCALGAV